MADQDNEAKPVEVEDLTQQPAELSEEDLKQVAGGLGVPVTGDLAAPVTSPVATPIKTVVTKIASLPGTEASFECKLCSSTSSARG